MSIDNEEFQAFMALSPEEQEAYLAQAQGQGDDESGEEEEVAEEPAQAQAVAQPQAQTAEQGAPAQVNDRTVSLSALHEERARRQALEKELADLRSQAQNPQQAEADAADAPSLMFEDERAIQQIVQKVQQETIGNFMPMLEKLKLYEQQQQEQAAIQALAARVQDPNAANLLAEFDAEVPEYRQSGMPADVRYWIARGIDSADPAKKAQIEAQVTASAQEMATQAKAKDLASRAQAPSSPTLAGLPPAAQNAPPPDPGSLSTSKLLSMPDGALDAMMRGDFSAIR